MNKKDQVSVVVPIFNIDEYLEECLNSIVNQKYADLEIILVNDGSTDKSGEICDYFAKTDNRVKVIHKDNGGLVSARKIGTESATGKYISFIDGDDWVKPDHFSKLYQSADNYSADLVISGHEKYFLGKRTKIKNNIDDGIYSRFEIESEIIPYFLYNGNFFQHGISTYVWNKLFLTDKVKDLISSIDERIVMAEDSCLTYPYLLQAEKVVITSDSNYIYRQRADSIIKSVPNKNLEYKRLSLAFRHLKRSFDQQSESFQLDTQLKNYIYSLLLVRSGGLFNLSEKEVYIPFTNIQNREKIIIYSTGAFGQQIYRSLIHNGGFKILGWLDEDYDESKKEGLDIIKEQDLTEFDYDSIIIASIDPKFNSIAYENLISLGVSREHISLLDFDQEKIKSAIESIGFNLEDYSFNEHSL